MCAPPQVLEKKTERTKTDYLYLLLKILVGRAQLASNFKRLGNFKIILGVGFTEIVKKAAAFANNLKETTARVVVFFVNLEVAGQLFDLRGEKGNLHTGRAGVFGTSGELLNNVYFGVMF